MGRVWRERLLWLGRLVDGGLDGLGTLPVGPRLGLLLCRLFRQLCPTRLRKLGRTRSNFGWGHLDGFVCVAEIDLLVSLLVRTL